MAEKEKLLQWHAAFFAGIQIELEEAEYLIFENEHMLSTKPMQVDVLIIKKNSERAIQKNIGRIFRKYNIVEYKSPEDYLSVDDFYKEIFRVTDSNPLFCIFPVFLFQNNSPRIEILDIPTEKEYTIFYGLNSTNQRKTIW